MEKQILQIESIGADEIFNRLERIENAILKNSTSSTVFIALPKCYNLEDIGAFQMDFLDLVASVDRDMADIEKIRNTIRFFMEMVFCPCQLRDFELGRPDEALNKDDGMNMVDETSH